jgi:hypothetical protein
MVQPTLVIYVQGGLVSHLTTSKDFPACRVLLCDYDVQGGDDRETLTEIRPHVPYGSAAENRPIPAHVFSLTPQPDSIATEETVRAWRSTPEGRASA